VRFIQGFICWGGGSSRFIYGPEKFNPDAPTWMANELQSAMPGALLGTDHLIDFLLYHFWLLYPAVILFSGAELIAVLRQHRVRTDKLTVSITSPLSD
jgi:thiosulfate dehydrogenase [quinone] large subunit